MASLNLTAQSSGQRIYDRALRILLTAAVFAAIYGLQASVSDGQEVRKTIRDYMSGPITYSPSDPWNRGKVFNLQTGHAGRYYNCDDEECKRNSPYICWRTHYENDIPQGRGLWRGLKMDIAEVRQRICDGAGPCCDSQCQCAECAAAASLSGRYVKSTPNTAEPTRLLSTGKQASAKTGAIADQRYGLMSAPTIR